METNKILINSENFPDVYLRKCIRKNFDKDGKGYLSKDIAEETTRMSIDVSNTQLARNCGYDIVPILDCENITNLKGLEFFPNLITLDCSNTNISELDTSKFTNLKVLKCENTNVSQLNLLENKELEVLECDHTNISKLDLSQNKKLIKLHANFVNFDKTIPLDISNSPLLEEVRTDHDTVLISKHQIYEMKKWSLDRLKIKYWSDESEKFLDREVICIDNFNEDISDELKEKINLFEDNKKSLHSECAKYESKELCDIAQQIDHGFHFDSLTTDIFECTGREMFGYDINPGYFIMNMDGQSLKSIVKAYCDLHEQYKSQKYLLHKEEWFSINENKFGENGIFRQYLEQDDMIGILKNRADLVKASFIRPYDFIADLNQHYENAMQEYKEQTMDGKRIVDEYLANQDVTLTEDDIADINELPVKTVDNSMQL